MGAGFYASFKTTIFYTAAVFAIGAGVGGYYGWKMCKNFYDIEQPHINSHVSKRDIRKKPFIEDIKRARTDIDNTRTDAVLLSYVIPEK